MPCMPSEIWEFWTCFYCFYPSPIDPCPFRCQLVYGTTPFIHCSVVVHGEAHRSCDALGVDGTVRSLSVARCNGYKISLAHSSSSSWSMLMVVQSSSPCCTVTCYHCRWGTLVGNVTSFLAKCYTAGTCHVVWCRCTCGLWVCSDRHTFLLLCQSSQFAWDYFLSTIRDLCTLYHTFRS